MVSGSFTQKNIDENGVEQIYINMQYGIPNLV
jgi:hypothetical protein